MVPLETRSRGAETAFAAGMEANRLTKKTRAPLQRVLNVGGRVGGNGLAPAAMIANQSEFVGPHGSIRPGTRAGGFRRHQLVGAEQSQGAIYRRAVDTHTATPGQGVERRGVQELFVAIEDFDEDRPLGSEPDAPGAQLVQESTSWVIFHLKTGAEGRRSYLQKYCN